MTQTASVAAAYTTSREEAAPAHAQRIAVQVDQSEQQQRGHRGGREQGHSELDDRRDEVELGLAVDAYTPQY